MATTIQKRQEKAQCEAEAFNARFRFGTRVRYWRDLREGEGREGEPRSEAQSVGGKAVVFITGCSGCIALTHVQVIDSEGDSP